MNVKKNLAELEKYQEITVADLKEGMEFKLLGQRKWRKVGKIIHNLPKPDEGKTLICYDGKQMVIWAEVQILINVEKTSNLGV